MTDKLNEHGRSLLFTEARTANRFLNKPIDMSVLQALYDLMKWGPTSMNQSPARITFVTTPEAKEMLKPALAGGNVARVESAPVIAIIGQDLRFFDHLPTLFPSAPDAGKMFEEDEEKAAVSAFRNSTLQGGYFILAARSVGLDCGPMSGFNNALVDQTFFADTSIKSNFICALGYADPEQYYPRGPRLSFDQACTVR
ncbi:malonic semialdehyde reductase [Veronia pacifica]|uniref:Putative NADH dehydrogenase/NAD(P)H nitroreductase A8L45_07985 n=2 Tax=Veronia pacifica TaxID=1080227 RepID=A0A1C3ELG3_9GAMM|nr:malonic semialdehyde reductase [Veronia pacifica]